MSQSTEKPQQDETPQEEKRGLKGLLKKPLYLAIGGALLLVLIAAIATTIVVSNKRAAEKTKAAAIAKRAYREGRPVFDVALEDSGLPAAELRRWLDPALLAKGGIHGK